MDPLSHRLATVLGTRLSEVVPASLTVSVHGSDVRIYADGVRIGNSANSVIVDEEDDRTLGEKAYAAVWGVLSAIQDDISEHLREPWPEDSGYRMAMPGVREERGRVFLWYGDNELDPRVAFAPIDLTKLSRGFGG